MDGHRLLQTSWTFIGLFIHYVQSQKKKKVTVLFLFTIFLKHYLVEHYYYFSKG